MQSTVGKIERASSKALWLLLQMSTLPVPGIGGGLKPLIRNKIRNSRYARLLIFLCQTSDV